MGLQIVGQALQTFRDSLLSSEPIAATCLNMKTEKINQEEYGDVYYTTLLLRHSNLAILEKYFVKSDKMEYHFINNGPNVSDVMTADLYGNNTELNKFIIEYNNIVAKIKAGEIQTAAVTGNMIVQTMANSSGINSQQTTQIENTTPEDKVIKLNKQDVEDTYLDLKYYLLHNDQEQLRSTIVDFFEGMCGLKGR